MFYKAGALNKCVGCLYGLFNVLLPDKMILELSNPLLVYSSTGTDQRL